MRDQDVVRQWTTTDILMYRGVETERPSFDELHCDDGGNGLGDRGDPQRRGDREWCGLSPLCNAKRPGREHIAIFDDDIRKARNRECGLEFLDLLLEHLDVQVPRALSGLARGTAAQGDGPQNGQRRNMSVESVGRHLSDGPSHGGEVWPSVLGQCQRPQADRRCDRSVPLHEALPSRLLHVVRLTVIRPVRLGPVGPATASSLRLILSS